MPSFQLRSAVHHQAARHPHAEASVRRTCSDPGEQSPSPSLTLPVRSVPHPFCKEAHTEVLPPARRPSRRDGRVDADHEGDEFAQFLQALLAQQDALQNRMVSLEEGQDRIFNAVQSIGQSMRNCVSPSVVNACLPQSTSRSSSVDSGVSGGEHAQSMQAQDSPAECDRSPSKHSSEEHANVIKCGCRMRHGFQALRTGVQTAAKPGNVYHEFREKSLTPASVQSMCIGQIVPIHPDSKFRLYIDVTVVALLLFDSGSVPYQLSFNPTATEGFWLIANWVTLVAWTIDLFFGFCIGYYERGRTVMRFREIARRYVRSFFIVDLLTVGCDWFGTVVPLVLTRQDAKHAHVVKVFRILKLSRLVRLMGAIHSGKFGQMHDQILNRSRKYGLEHQLQFAANIITLTLLILWVNHIACCLWFTVQTDAILNWESSNIPETSEGMTQTAGWQYYLCFYWSMTSMVSGASIMSPTNVGELTFTIFYVLFGLLVGSTLISSLAAMLLELQASTRDRRDSVRLLRQYLFQQGLDVGLAMAVEKEVVERLWYIRRLGANEVDCLRLLSPTTRSNLNYAIYCQPLKQHSFLGACHILDSSRSFTRDLCEEAVSHYNAGPGTLVFGNGDSCEGPCHVVIGRLEYRVKDIDASRVTPSMKIRGNPSLKVYSTAVESGQWLSELAVWLEWRHRGWLYTSLHCEYFSVRAEVLLRAFTRCDDLRLAARAYGEALCSAVETEERLPLTDLPVREEFHQSVVLSMPPEGRRALSAAALALLQENGRNRARVSRLAEQVDQGKCDLVIMKGQVIRVVSVVVLRVERAAAAAQGRGGRQVLAQLSRSTRSGEPACQLLGGRVLAGEKPSDALARLLAGQLAGLQQAGLRQEELHRDDDEMELVEAVEPGARELRVSVLKGLALDGLVQVEGWGPVGSVCETCAVADVDATSGIVKLDRPLKHHYPEASRISSVARSKWSDEYCVETKYIRNVFCGRLETELSGGAARPLPRRRRAACLAEGPPPPGRRDPTDYPAFELLPSTGGPEEGRGEGRGIPCAWLDEEDFETLSATPAGAGMVKAWAQELQDGAVGPAESTTTARSSRGDASPRAAATPTPRSGRGEARCLRQARSTGLEDDGEVSPVWSWATARAPSFGEAGSAGSGQAPGERAPGALAI